ncbi:hypothetical protein HPB48_007690 [Haemaphysalis longicornis]|uniref:EF-hand domain-containing protein n=1 Tax=Haemaphysalis longicornis TaxID=44386 RepID=A0A9J6G3Q8_HAELO|nr:hypothetical protein HPB48_007690 [Haemaphysalis longicornis]
MSLLECRKMDELANGPQQPHEILGPIDKPRISFGEFLTLMTKDVQAISAEEEIRQAFEVFDRNGDGLVSCTELRQAMTTLGHKLSLDLVEEMIREADKDGDGKINFEEFVTMLTLK